GGSFFSIRTSYYSSNPHTRPSTPYRNLPNPTTKTVAAGAWVAGFGPESYKNITLPPTKTNFISMWWADH
ncbi:hypothetical protein, partial [Enterobacter sichuanensis]